MENAIAFENGYDCLGPIGFDYLMRKLDTMYKSGAISEAEYLLRWQDLAAELNKNY